MAIGALSVHLGIPSSIAVVAVGPVLGAALVLRYAPETRGMTLEEIEEALGGRGSRVAAPAEP
jgi:H+/Cl- antiporter ClcA